MLILNNWNAVNLRVEKMEGVFQMTNNVLPSTAGIEVG